MNCLASNIYGEIISEKELQKMTQRCVKKKKKSMGFAFNTLCYPLDQCKWSWKLRHGYKKINTGATTRNQNLKHTHTNIKKQSHGEKQQN